MSNFVYTLKDLMIEHNLTQSKLAEVLEIDCSTISKYLCGNQSPDFDILIKIADYFDCTLDYLLGRTDENKRKDFHACPPFSTRFLFLLDKYKLSRYKLQQNTHIAKSTMYYWQTGKSKPTIDSLIALAKEFGCSVDFVVGRVDFE